MTQARFPASRLTFRTVSGNVRADSSGRTPVSDAPYRAGLVAIVGRPNVGKSTLMNALLGEKVAITADRPQTTRDAIRGILSREGYQVVFVDTPGIHDASKPLNRILVRRALEVLEGVDAAVLVVDGADYASGRINGLHRQDRRILDVLKEAGLPTLVAINKVDLVSKKVKLLPVADLFGKEPPVESLFMVSAEGADGTADVLADLVARLPESDGPLYDPEIVSDAPLRFHAAEIIRERIFRLTREEIPYATAVEIERFDESTTPVEVLARIYVEKDSQRGILIGHEGEMISKIRQGAVRRLNALVGAKVHLELHISVAKDWSQDQRRLKDLGYE